LSHKATGYQILLEIPATVVQAVISGNHPDIAQHPDVRALQEHQVAIQRFVIRTWKFLPLLLLLVGASLAAELFSLLATYSYLQLLSPPFKPTVSRRRVSPLITKRKWKHVSVAIIQAV
jgi:hypothetical protein